jgi:hypothetical protein
MAFGNLTIGNSVIGKMVIGKKSRRRSRDKIYEWSRKMRKYLIVGL